MKIRFHREFPKEVQKCQAEYAAISAALAQRFQRELTLAVEAIKASPLGAGHYVNTGSRVVREVRRRNLRVFPYFIVYAATDDTTFIASVLPNRSDPLTWLKRF